MHYMFHLFIARLVAQYWCILMDRWHRGDLLYSILHFVLAFCLCLMLVKVIGRNM